MLDPRLLQIFITAAESLNFSAAAKKLHLSQPAVTQNIRQLELQVGEPLFIRAGRSVKLSPSGAVLLPMARQLLAMNIRVESLLDDMSGKVFGELIIACSTTPGKYVLPGLLANFMLLHPQVRALCNVAPRSSAMEMLEAGKVHFAFTSNAELFGPDIEFLRFLRDPIKLIVPLDHPWAEKPSIDIETLKTGRFVMRDPGSGMFQKLKDRLAEYGIGISDLHSIMTVGSTEAVGVAVSQGLAAGFVSTVMHHHLTRDKVAVANVEGLNATQDVFLCRHKGFPMGNPASSFWTFAQEITENGKRDILPDLLATD